MKIKIDGIPPSLNRFVGRKNVWEYREAKEMWTNLVYYAALEQKPEKPLDRAFVHINVVYPDRRRHDVGNHEKFLTDGLVKAGVIADDDYTHIDLLVTGSYQYGRKETVIFVDKIKVPSHLRMKFALGIPLTDEEREEYKRIEW